MIKLSLLPRVGSMWTNFLRDIEDLPTSLKGEQLTDLLESEPIRRRLRVEFCTHGRCFGNDVTNVTIRSQCFRTAGVFDLPGSPLSSGLPLKHILLRLPSTSKRPLFHHGWRRCESHLLSFTRCRAHTCRMTLLPSK